MQKTNSYVLSKDQIKVRFGHHGNTLGTFMHIKKDFKILVKIWKHEFWIFFFQFLVVSDHSESTLNFYKYDGVGGGDPKFVFPE